MTAGALRALDRFWFEEAPAARLGVLRVLVGLYALYEGVKHYEQWTDIARTTTSLFLPVGVASFLSAPIPPHLFDGMVALCLAANVAFVLGWRHRYTGPVFALSLLAVLTYRNSWTMLYHSSNLMLLHVLILGFTPSADAVSVDAWLAARRKEPLPEDPSWVYGWPIRLICTLTAVSYLLAGVAKVAGPLGWAWASGEGLRSQVAANALRKELLGDPGPALFYTLYDWTWLFAGLAVLSLALELLAPLALLEKRVARVWSVLTLAMHWGILFIMGITFRYHLSGLAFASFFPLERLVPGKQLLAPLQAGLAWLGREPQRGASP